YIISLYLFLLKFCIFIKNQLVHEIDPVSVKSVVISDYYLRCAFYSIYIVFRKLVIVSFVTMGD
ncbi:hypothetical protein, partial [Bacillus toyonensis]|uniref:hypothetical protein n=1 Tax=Bacillus toyonensis TaxID=155322 RepID=UPI001C5565AD